MKILTETLQALEEKKQRLEGEKVNGKERRLKNINHTIYCVCYWVQLRIDGTITEEDTDPLCLNVMKYIIK